MANVKISDLPAGGALTGTEVFECEQPPTVSSVKVTANQIGTFAVAQAVGTSAGSRLTLTSATPVLTSTVSAATTVYYTPYQHQFVPLYNGTSFLLTDTGGELSQTTADNSKSPASVVANSNYDVFVWNDAGTMRATRGPLWTSDTARGTGAGTTELVRVKGILLNANSITNGPAAQRGTYVGTIRSNGSSQIDFIYAAVGAGGTAGVVGVWNAYNRVNINMFVGDNTNSWTYNTAAWRAANASNTMRVSFVSGLSEDFFDARYTISMTMDSGNASIGVGIDTTTNFNGEAGFLQVPSVGTVLSATGEAVGFALGYHFVQAVEYANTAGTITFYGDVGVTFVQTGMTFNWRC